MPLIVNIPPFVVNSPFHGLRVVPCKLTYNYHCFCFFTMIKYLCIIEKKSEDSLMVSFGNNRRRKCSMNTLEVLTLVLVIFTALAYIDNHQNKK